MVFARRLHYPETLVENTISHFIEMKVTENVCSKSTGQTRCPHQNCITVQRPEINRQMR